MFYRCGVAGLSLLSSLPGGPPTGPGLVLVSVIRRGAEAPAEGCPRLYPTQDSCSEPPGPWVPQGPPEHVLPTPRVRCVEDSHTAALKGDIVAPRDPSGPVRATWTGKHLGRTWPPTGHRPGGLGSQVQGSGTATELEGGTLFLRADVSESRS